MEVKEKQTVVLVPFPEKGKVPQCVDVEETVIGQLLIDSEAFEKVKDILRSEMFYSENNKAIFQAICELKEINIGINMITVIDKLRKKNELDKCGGAFQITNLCQKISSSIHVEYHARIVHQTWLRRYILAQSYRLFEMGYEINNDIQDSKVFIDSLKNTLDFEVNKKSDNFYEETIIRSDILINKSVFYISLVKEGQTIGLMSENSMSMIYGPRGSRKTTLLALITGYICSGINDSSFITKRQKVKIFDTEQSEYYVQKTLHRIIFVAKNDDSCISIHSLKKYNKITKRIIVEMAIEKDKPKVVVIDNIRHFVSNILDFKESGELLEWLLYIQSKYLCHICCVIHQNKGDNNSRGHLGAELETACEMVLRVRKDDDNKAQSIVSFEKTRDGLEPDEEILQVDENNMPSLVRGLSNVDANILFTQNRYEKDEPF